MINKALLKEMCLEHNVDLNDEQLQKLDEFSEILVEWNKKFNLTAITSPNEIVYKHFIDSFLIFRAIDLKFNSCFFS